MVGVIFGKNWRNLPISNPKPLLPNINAHTELGENILVFAPILSGNKNRIEVPPIVLYGWTDRRTDTQITKEKQ